jgi:hypothetical protein
LPEELQISLSLMKSAARRRPGAAFGIALGALLLVFYFDPLFVARGFGDRDTIPFFLPVEKAVHESWQHLRVPHILPEVSFGKMLAANPNTGAFYPLRIAMAALPFSVAFKVFPVLHLWIAGMGLFFLARLRGASPAAACAGALVLAFCGPAVSDLLFPNILPGLAWMPWLFCASALAARRPSPRAAAAVGAVWALHLLAGDAFTAGLALSGAVLVAIEEAVDRRRVAGFLGWGLAGGTLTAAIQWVPAAFYAPLTVRALGRFSVARALAWSIHPWRFLELVVALPFGDVTRPARVWGEKIWSGKASGFFSTLHMGAFAALSWTIARPKKRLFLVGFGALSLAASVAGSLFPASVLSGASPVPLRYPEKLFAGVAVVGGLVVAEAFDRLGQRRGLAFAASSSTLLILAAAAIARFPDLFARFVDSHWAADRGALAATQMPSILLESALRWGVLAAVLFAFRGRRGQKALLLLLLMVDLAWVDLKFVTTTPAGRIALPSPEARAVLAANRGRAFAFFPLWEKTWPAGGAPLFGVPSEIRRYLASDVGAAWGIDYAFNSDFDASDLYRVELARREVARAGPADPAIGLFLASFAARTSLSTERSAPYGFSGPAARAGQATLLTNPAALPRIRLVSVFRQARNVSEAYAMVHGSPGAILEAPVVETGRSGSIGRASLGRTRVTLANPQELRVETDTPGAGLLLLPLCSHPFRDVCVDGSIAASYPANLCWTAVPLSPGRHRVEVNERLPGGVSGPLLSLAGLAVLALAARRG